MTENLPSSAGEPVHPIVAMTDQDLAALMRRAVRGTLALGLVLAVVAAIGWGWRNGGMMAVGAIISAASLYEWMRLIRLFNARIDSQLAAEQKPRGTALVVSFFLLRLGLFGAVLYGSLKGLEGSPLVLVGGLCLAMVALVWEALRMLRG